MFLIEFGYIEENLELLYREMYKQNNVKFNYFNDYNFVMVGILVMRILRVVLKVGTILKLTNNRWISAFCISHND